MTGIICRCTGGLYTVLSDGKFYECKARGVFRHKKSSPLVGDTCEFTFDSKLGNPIEKIHERKNSLIRPAMANLDLLFVTFAACSPDPDPLYVDKLVSVAVYNNITPIIIITKSDLNASQAQRYKSIYEKAKCKVFVVSSVDNVGTDELKEFIKENDDKIISFAGPSGVGKSTLLNTLFGDLELKTGDISEKIERGKHTTREISLFPLSRFFEAASGFIADTPGFTMLDFINFNFFELDDLTSTFPEFENLLGECQWRDCTHTKEDNCKIKEEVANGSIAKTRYESYLSMVDELKQRKQW